ncbi:MAG: TadE/TadG family type IV pilus assembly protein [Terriglobales bacterium]
MARADFWTDIVRSLQASSLAEFAVSLPLLVVLVVGIFDFGGAFNQKQQLNNAVREGARFGASQPTNDVAAGVAPPSIDAIRYLVDAYLQTKRINDCGLGTAGLPASGPPWQYSAATGCGGTLLLTIKKDPQVNPPGPLGPPGTCNLTVPANTYGSPDPIPVGVNIACTSVTISYPYQWHFNSVIQLLVPGANLALTQISTSATVPNTN